MGRVAIAALILWGVPLILLLIGAFIIVRAAVSLRARSTTRVAGTLRILAGVGAMGGALISVAGLVVEVHYAVVIFPFLGMTSALIWGLGFLGAAAIAERAARRGHPAG